ncbi:MAG TPA: hypothetical protein VFQ84_07470 [Arenimonas sp.]|uniref:lipase family alpha/beta hydrolase n=1 Tax=Arenimonas sp. TaxID=1872635 RepID=UPI002D806925|nr:hypothetical protein [Arenimonas sp.]HEU0153166.1 hypothetical protein [Arenimonas sp.]
MEIVFVVPGIMGSELYLREEKIWPPSPGRSLRNPDRLLDPKVVVGDLIRDVLVFNFYSQLLKPLRSWGYNETTPGKHGLVVPWPYNWVKGVPESAALLADSIRVQLNKHPDSEVVLLAHSMGGLICTYALECLGEAGNEVPWRDRVRLLVTFGTPFRGAPEALFNAFGIEGVQGIQASDCQALMADKRFPSAYQLFPHLHTDSMWQLQAPLNPITGYQALDPQGPALGAENLASALAFQLALKKGKPNPATRKFNFCGTSYSTIWGISQAIVPGDIVDPFKSKSGDGTVPSWSGQQLHDVQFAPLGQKHSTTFGSDDVLLVLRDLLRRSIDVPPSGGATVRLSRKPRPAPTRQPAVSITRNSMSSRRAMVEVQIAEPPVDGHLKLGWMTVQNVRTTDDLAGFMSRQALSSLVSAAVVPLGEETEFPTTIAIPRPPGIGEYALVAWSGEDQPLLTELDASAMDVLWVFEDDGRCGEAGQMSNPEINELIRVIERAFGVDEKEASRLDAPPLQNAQD